MSSEDMSYENINIIDYDYENDRFNNIGLLCSDAFNKLGIKYTGFGVNPKLHSEDLMTIWEWIEDTFQVDWAPKKTNEENENKKYMGELPDVSKYVYGRSRIEVFCKCFLILASDIIEKKNKEK